MLRSRLRAKERLNRRLSVKERVKELRSGLMRRFMRLTERGVILCVCLTPRGFVLL